MSAPAALPPAIIMGGGAGNALSVARSLGRQGVEVHLLLDGPDVHSRYARAIRLPAGADHQRAWARYLLGPQSEALRGAVLLSCSDAGIELLIEHREELAEKFIIDVSDPVAQRCLLGKLTTYKKAREAGVPTPLFWTAESIEQVKACKSDYVYPLIVKPLYSHKFHAVFHDKFFRVTDFDGLLDAYRRVRDHGLEVMLLEEIPGPDDRLCSYYTYIDENGEPLCDFTKRVIRRYPENRGLACYHVTDWNPEVRDLGLRLFRHVGLKGVGNLELKRDARDGKLKVIESNARFTAANALLVASGYDLALFVYNRLAGIPQPQLKGRKYELGLHYWFPANDLRAFLAMRAQKRLSFAGWAASLAHRQVVPYFRWDDPVPWLVMSAATARRVTEVGLLRVAQRQRGFKSPQATVEEGQ
jgi:D-aspartate ligase